MRRDASTTTATRDPTFVPRVSTRAGRSTASRQKTAATIPEIRTRPRWRSRERASKMSQSSQASTTSPATMPEAHETSSLTDQDIYLACPRRRINHEA
jgi:hypothetical protein